MSENPDALAADERVELRVPLGRGDLVVTDRRVFRLLPGGDAVGAVAREDVAGVATTRVRREPKLRAGTAAVLGAASLLPADRLYPFAPSVPVEREAAARMGVADTVAVFRSLLDVLGLDVLGLVDEGLAAVGLLFGGYAVVHVARSLEQTLVHERAEGRRVRLAAPALDDGDVERVRAVLGADASASTPAGD